MTRMDTIIFLETTKCGLVTCTPLDKALVFDWICSPVWVPAVATLYGQR